MSFEPNAYMKNLFAYEHLKEGEIRDASIKFAEFAQQYMDEAVSPAVATKVLWLLWEAKNLAVYDVAQNGSH